MSELTAKQLIPYLGTGLEVEILTARGLKTFEMTGLKFHPGEQPYISCLSSQGVTHGFYWNTYTITPIMRPFADLTREIDHQGERFVPMMRLGELYPGFHKPHLVVGEFSDNEDEYDVYVGDTQTIMIVWEEYMVQIQSRDGRHIFPVPNWLIDILRQWQFPVGLPAGSWKEIKSG